MISSRVLQFNLKNSNFYQASYLHSGFDSLARLPSIGVLDEHFCQDRVVLEILEDEIFGDVGFRARVAQQGILHPGAGEVADADFDCDITNLHKYFFKLQIVLLKVYILFRKIPGCSRCQSYRIWTCCSCHNSGRSTA